MGIAIGILLCLSLLNIVVLFALCYLIYKLYNSNEKVITDICKIEDNITEIKGYLGEDFATFHEQN